MYVTRRVGVSKLNKNSRETQVRQIISDSIEDVGYSVVQVRWLSSGSRDSLRIMIEREDRGSISIEDCTRVTRMVSPLLDVYDDNWGSYILEVTSPGLERPLVSLSDYQRYVGYRVFLKLQRHAQETHKRKKCKGHILKVEGSDILLEVEGQKIALPYAHIESGNLLIDTEELLGKQGKK